MTDPMDTPGSPDEPEFDEEGFEGPHIGFIVAIVVALLFLEELLCCGGLLVVNYALGK